MSNSKYDSEFCGSLPIHLINLIQPYGVLLVLDKSTYNIIQASENCDKIFGISATQLVRTNLTSHISADDLSILRETNNLPVQEKIPAIWKIMDKDYLVLVHPKEDLLLIELDLTEDRSTQQRTFVEVYQEIKLAMALIQSASTITEVAVATARELKRISGFDKVMVYSFDKEWNGTVIAEEREGEMESYHGFTFPASDIPQPARQLYLRNAYRFIPVREYEPVKLYPVINPITNTFLDLSDCNVRGVAAVHLEYLKNMNVMSSMSTRILMGNQLWGLIACHHRSAKYMSYEMLSIFEMISNIISAKITSLQNSETHVLNSRLGEDFKHIVEEAYRRNHLQEALLDGSPDVLTLFNAQGAVYAKKGKLYHKGIVPDDESLKEFLLWLHTRHLKSILHTDRLGDEYDLAASFKDKASGVLVIPVNSHDDEYILVFRPEVIRTIKWGGNPNERIRFDEDEKNYHPRHSFRLWKEHVDGTSLPWREQELMVAENLRSFIYEFNN